MRDFNLYPITENLLTLERKYGDSLNHEDLYGFKQRKKRKAKVGADGSTVQEDGTTENLSEGKTVTFEKTSNKEPSELD